MIDDKTILGLICARGGSKGLTGKNIKSLGGKPLIGWSIQTANACRYIDRIIVSTDDPVIAQTARRLGAEVPFMRPGALAEDETPIWPVWRHAVRSMQENDNFYPDYMVELPPTAPLRAVEDVEKSILLLHQGEADIIISVVPAGSNPYFNMIEMDNAGFARLVKQPQHYLQRRQDAPKVFDITTVVYAATTEYIARANSLFEGRVKALIVPEERGVDIDTELDFKFAEFLIAQGRVPAHETHRPTH